jgi:hypothetical protein
MSRRGRYVEAFVRVIAAQLPGPSDARQEILDELRDGLLAASEAHERAGAQPATALQLAIGEFGEPAAIARGFLPELALRRARRIAATLSGSVVLVIAAWLTAARTRDITHSQPLFDSSAAHLAAALLLGLLVFAAGLTFISSGSGSRWLGTTRVPVFGAVALAVLAVLTE